MIPADEHQETSSETSESGAPATGSAGRDPEVGGTAADPPQDGGARGFEVHLDVFDGPFDLLLSLISKHKLDITEVALAKVTDEFVSHVRGMQQLDLDLLTEFLVVAATLLDLKAARLLPSADVDDEEDLALLEARDLLFARLLEYRAYKQIAGWIAQRQTDEATWTPRDVAVPEEFAAALPEVLLGITPAEFARVATVAMTPKEPPVVVVDHIHLTRVSVPEHMTTLSRRLSELGSATFRRLCADCTQTIEVVARFLAVLELYREGSIALQQVTPLGDMHLRWVGRPDASADDEADSMSRGRLEQDGPEHDSDEPTEGRG